MAKNTGNNRIPVKWIRDGAKAAYEKRCSCDICNTTEDLELHHAHSLTLLLQKWVTETGYDISTDEKVIAIRDEFIEKHRKELYDDVYTLCNKHHVALHRVYGKAPPLSTATKQGNWVKIQKEKFENGGTEETPRPKLSLFAEFL